jgi:hypothetical protein
MKNQISPPTPYIPKPSGNKREQLIRRLEEKELKIRCIAVNMCPECGKDLKDKSYISSHWTELACANRRCKKYGAVVKSWR